MRPLAFGLVVRILLLTSLCNVSFFLSSSKDSYGIFYDPVPANVAGYRDVIKHPMSFSDMKKKLDAGKYTTSAAFQVPAHPVLP